MKIQTAKKILDYEFSQMRIEVIPKEAYENLLEASEILTKNELLEMLQDYINNGVIK